MFFFIFKAFARFEPVVDISGGKCYDPGVPFFIKSIFEIACLIVFTMINIVKA
jgi:hypothetical protein